MAENQWRILCRRWLEFDRRSKRRKACRHVSVEPLEIRLVLSASRPLAVDDAFSMDSRIDEGQKPEDTGSYFDVLKNDLTIANASLFSSLVITGGPVHGTAEVVENGRIDYLGGIDPETGALLDTVDDEDSPVGDGHASALSGVVDQYGQIHLKVSEFLDIGFDGVHYAEPFGGPVITGDYALFIRRGTSDFTSFDSSKFDFQYRDRLRRGKVDSYVVSGQIPGTPFTTWIDNTVGVGRPDTLMLNSGPFELHYVPATGFIGTDVFHYALKYPNGSLSREATVTITVRNRQPEADGENNGNYSVTYQDVRVAVGSASDLDGTINASSLTLVTLPLHGTVEVQPTDEGYFQYTPDSGFLGTDSFSFTVKDDRGALSNVGMVTIDVLDPNQRPVATDDLASAKLNTRVTIDVLANDYDGDGSLDASSLTISQPPTHGRAFIIQVPVSGIYSTFVVYEADLGYLGPDEFCYTFRDNKGTLSDPALVTINPQPQSADDTASTLEATPVLIDVLANDAPSVNGALLVPSSLALRTSPRRGRVVFRQTNAGTMAVYTPNAGMAAQLMVDDPSDRDDGNYSTGHLSLREAIKLANADRFTDTFAYTVRDKFGICSNVSTVTVNVKPKPTTIRFSPKLTGRTSTIRLTHAGDTSDGNTALVITSKIQIIGPTRGYPLTLAGMGRASDLRLFLVTHDGDLALSNLNLTRSASDGSGGALSVTVGATASLNSCVLTDNFAFLQGGAISSFGTVSLTNCKLSRNTAEQGGGISSFGTVTIINSSLTSNHAEHGGGLHNGMGSTTLDNVTLKNNTAHVSGGGLFNDGTVTATKSQFQGNHAEKGGGFFTLGAITLTDCTISRNTADTGGGLENGSATPAIGPLIQSAGAVTLTRSTVSGNTARQGGGFYNVGMVVATECTIANNHAQQGGGFLNSDFGLHLEASSTTLNACAVTGNVADLGGGSYVDQGTVTLTNSTLGANSARRGGGLYNRFGSSTLLSTTVSNNLACMGGGLFNEAGLVKLTSTIVAGNHGIKGQADIAGPVPINVAASSSNLIGTGGSGGLQSGVGGNLVAVAPLLGRLGTYGGSVASFPLLPGSPAINAGTGTTVDLRGVLAVGQRDIGAFESHGFQLTVKKGSGQTAKPGSPFLQPLKVIVSAVNSLEPVAGGTVTFTSPASGASARLSKAIATIGSNRTAKVEAVAANAAGVYRVQANTAGARSTAFFTLTNKSTRTVTPTAAPLKKPQLQSTTTAAAQKTIKTVPLGNLDWSAGYATLPIDKTEYKLNSLNRLLRRVPGGHWEVLEKGVRSFAQTPNGDLYLLNDGGELKRLQLGYSWSILQSGVQSFSIDAFGTVFVRDNLNFVTTHSALDHYYVLPPLSPGSPYYAMDPPSDFEAVHAMGIDSERGGGQGRWVLPNAYLLNDVQYFPRGPAFPLTNELQAPLAEAGRPVPEPVNPPKRDFDTSYYNNLRIVKELILDRVDSPRFFPGVGMAQLHHEQYKVTIYSSTLMANPTFHYPGPGFVNYDFPFQIDRVYISHDHFHALTSAPVAPQSAASIPKATTSNSVVAPTASLAEAAKSSTQTNYSVAASQGLGSSGQMITAPDGTIYKPGRGQNGFPIIGNEATPYFLWQLKPNGLWKPLDYVKAHAVGADSRLYALDTHNALRTPALGPSKWATLASDVRSFALTQDGTLFVLGMNGELRTRAAGATQWSKSESGVTSLMIGPGGQIYTTTNSLDLRVLRPGGQWRTMDRGVKSFAMVADGSLYELNGRSQLVRIEPQGNSKLLSKNVKAMQVAPNGGVFVLTQSQQLMKLTARDHWTILETGVRTFQITANGNLYLINQRNELRRLKEENLWQTLQTDAQSLKMYSNGTVYVYDHNQTPTLFSSWGHDFVLAPVAPDVEVLAEPPTELEILRAANLRRGQFDYDYLIPANANEYGYRLDIESRVAFSSVDSRPAPILGDQSGRMPPPLRYTSFEYPDAPLITVPSPAYVWVVTETIPDLLEPPRFEPPRFVPGIGPAQVHRGQFKSTITYIVDEVTLAQKTIVIYIDRDHYHFVAPQ